MGGKETQNACCSSARKPPAAKRGEAGDSSPSTNGSSAAHMKEGWGNSPGLSC
ncbi:unnamed protein product [Ectocarpus sp. CCAP 1310/34]|nr:unnamed protein product [Ectocarpus sp. CCAP 1310/34]